MQTGTDRMTRRQLGKLAAAGSAAFLPAARATAQNNAQNSAQIVGATSTIAGFSSMNLWLENRTPGTSRGSMQWSPLQALVLDRKSVVEGKSVDLGGRR